MQTNQPNNLRYIHGQDPAERLAAAWGKLIADQDKYSSAQEKRDALLAEYEKMEAEHADISKSCWRSINEHYAKRDQASEAIRQLSASSAKEYLEKCQPHQSVIDYCYERVYVLRKIIRSMRQERSETLYAIVEANIARRATELQQDDAHKKFKQAVVAIAGIPLESRSGAWIKFENPEKDIHILFGIKEDPKSPYHGHFILHPDGSVTVRHMPRPHREFA